MRHGQWTQPVHSYTFCSHLDQHTTSKDKNGNFSRDHKKITDLLWIDFYLNKEFTSIDIASLATVLFSNFGNSRINQVFMKLLIKWFPIIKLINDTLGNALLCYPANLQSASILTAPFCFRKSVKTSSLRHFCLLCHQWISCSWPDALCVKAVSWSNCCLWRILR